jgi:hypothetical protein
MKKAASLNEISENENQRNWRNGEKEMKQSSKTGGYRNGEKHEKQYQIIGVKSKRRRINGEENVNGGEM